MAVLKKEGRVILTDDELRVDLERGIVGTLLSRMSMEKNRSKYLKNGIYMYALEGYKNDGLGIKSGIFSKDICMRVNKEQMVYITRPVSRYFDGYLEERIKAVTLRCEIDLLNYSMMYMASNHIFKNVSIWENADGVLFVEVELRELSAEVMPYAKYEDFLMNSDWKDVHISYKFTNIMQKCAKYVDSSREYFVGRVWMYKGSPSIGVFGGENTIMQMYNYNSKHIPQMLSNLIKELIYYWEKTPYKIKDIYWLYKDGNTTPDIARIKRHSDGEYTIVIEL